MKPPPEPIDTEALARIFHEPGRLAIMSALCAAQDGIAFTDLRATCSLTDGNLNRHLNALAEAGAIRVDKRFVRGRPRTTVFVSQRGLRRFTEYLDALEQALRAAQAALPARRRAAAGAPALAQPAEA